MFDYWTVAEVLMAEEVLVLIQITQASTQWKKDRTVHLCSLEDLLATAFVFLVPVSLVEFPGRDPQEFQDF